jgi:transposase InsO family protein
MTTSSGIRELKTPYRIPQANGVCERFIGSLRRECLDHIADQWMYNIQSNPGWTSSHVFPRDLFELIPQCSASEPDEQG